MKIGSIIIQKVGIVWRCAEVCTGNKLRLRGVLEQVKLAENCVDKCEDEYKSVVTWLDGINI